MIGPMVEEVGLRRMPSRWRWQTASLVTERCINVATHTCAAGGSRVRRALCMIGPTVEEVGLRRMPVAVAVASLTAVAGLLAVTTAVAGCGGGDTGSDHVMVNGGEPQNPLIPTNTNETNGGRIWAKPQY